MLTTSISFILMKLKNGQPPNKALNTDAGKAPRLLAESLGKISIRDEFMGTENSIYGVGDCSYRSAGELPGLIKLVDSFYDFMEILPEAGKVRNMHGADLTVSRKKLAYFLSGWLGGPKLYSENFGPINIPGAHRHFPIGAEESEAWILCMQKP